MRFQSGKSNFGFRCGLSVVAVIFGLMCLVCSGSSAAQGTAQGSGIPVGQILGKWTLHPHSKGTPPPPPPPVYASYRRQAEERPFESVPRVVLGEQEGQLTGRAVFPDGIVLTEENRDVAGKEEISLSEIKFDGELLSFKVEVEGELLEALLKYDQNRFLGSWKSLSSEKSGDLYLVKRN